MTTDIAGLASSLSQTDRANLVRFREGVDYPFWAIFGLLHKGMAVSRKRWRLFGPQILMLTPLGLALRTFLTNPGEPHEG